VTAAEWEPGDPIGPNNGCGAYVTPTYTLDETAEARAEDDTPPPWWRPGEGPQNFAHTSRCVPCGVRWRGPEPCWICGGDAE
jgi:hypothetical protein